MDRKVSKTWTGLASSLFSFQNLCTNFLSLFACVFIVYLFFILLLMFYIFCPASPFASKLLTFISFYFPSFLPGFTLFLPLYL